jgi:hypothetical protein
MPLSSAAVVVRLCCCPLLPPSFAAAAIITTPLSLSSLTARWYGARMGGSKSNTVTLILRLFLYHILHTMSLWRHESIRNNTNNQQTPPPWWWSRLPLQRGGFDDTTQPKGRAALRMFTPRPLLKDIVWFVE